MTLHKRFLPLLLLPLVAVAPQAQAPKGKVGYLNVQAAVKAMPGSASYLSVVSKADSDLAARQKTIQALSKTASATKAAKDMTALQNAQKAYAQAQNTHMQAINKAMQPLAAKLNPVVAKTAKANGYTVILDQRVAAQSNLVVYANTGADLTAAVVKALK